MTINLEMECEVNFPFDVEEVANNVINAVLDWENCPYEAEVSVTLTNNEEIKIINNEQRGIDRPTDVLSFPMTQFPVPGNFDFLEEDEMMDSFHPESGELMLGDIVISVDKVISQAEEYGHSQKREFAFLIAHSMLHLIGYDHMEPEEAAVMEKKQGEILDSIGITRNESLI